jgi:hypothetical protein
MTGRKGVSSKVLRIGHHGRLSLDYQAKPPKFIIFGDPVEDPVGKIACTR